MLHAVADISFDKDYDDNYFIAALASVMKTRTHKLDDGDQLVKCTSSILFSPRRQGGTPRPQISGKI